MSIGAVLFISVSGIVLVAAIVLWQAVQLQELAEALLRQGAETDHLRGVVLAFAEDVYGEGASNTLPDNHYNGAVPDKLARIRDRTTTTAG